MKKCIECGKNNGISRMMFVGAKCENCYYGREIVKEVVLPREKAVKKCSRCKCSQNEENSYLRRGGDFDTYCRECSKIRYYEKKLKGINYGN